VLGGGGDKDIAMRKLALAVAFGLVMASPAVAQQSDDCTGACEEGYLWAQEQGITSPDACAGKPSEFAAGCLSYLDDAANGTDGGEDDDTE